MTKGNIKVVIDKKRKAPLKKVIGIAMFNILSDISVSKSLE